MQCARPRNVPKILLSKIDDEYNWLRGTIFIEDQHHQLQRILLYSGISRNSVLEFSK